MRDLSKLLWCDLKNDEERIDFLLSGRAYDTGIISPNMIPVVVDLLKRANKYECAYLELKDAAINLVDRLEFDPEVKKFNWWLDERIKIKVIIDCVDKDLEYQ